ncbi:MULTISPECIES: outer membrane protein assembly factor BamD [unclassified Brevundimonas]|uniref:outer membrane protein assembly factor BamD n=1 Tax=unclassified Brevundimonas TaxID=2622653 RepID=UPI000CFAD045|nr:MULTISPECIES: outer membrane protein assembly factor BamD [unclassified Brevundimonas]PRA22377.1 outer membrane protein assembly factor BamD [Brevundimonas sp. MYb27]PQZ74074.1 outer membrane protein assembly factor BamD [Brevundimonas sp. MYb31]PRB10816.1 outer membrane protein assembly factor BamD [Brevundimonas sp. MYb52]PRB32416.1 outer membrane protein assembly factor BamD [Brevundimonas sp. MYb46]PRB50351.1 outer membrane protein assembly factor BamD [Brevundimonas sp. MYb33]
MTVAVAALTVSACAGNKPRQKLVYEERPVEMLYNTGYQRLQSKRWTDAVDYFQEVERQHPYSEWSRRAILMQVYAYYQNNNYQDAIAAADRFIALFPGNPSAAYAFYMRAICNFEQIVDVGRDQAYAEAALAGLRDVARRYPNTPYATDARVKIDMVNDQLAGKEMAVGRFYQRANQPLAALNRYKAVINNEAFQRSSHTPEALYRLVEVNVALGLTEEATRNAAVLGHNYPGSAWYAEAYALLTERGARPDVQPEAKRESWLQRIIPGGA